MSSSSNSSTSSPSSNASSERIYDFQYMMKLAASSASAMSSTSTLAQLSVDEDVAEIVKPSPSQDDVDDSDKYSDSDSEDEDEYGSWYDIRTDLSDEQIEELRNAVYDAISSTSPLSPEDDVPLSFAPPQQESSQYPQYSQYSAPIVQTTKSSLTFAPPTQFQSRAFATLAARRPGQSQFAQRQSYTRTHTQTAATFKFGRQGAGPITASNPFNVHNPSNAFKWRRDVPTNLNLRQTTQPRNNPLLRSNSKPNVNVNVNVNAVSWRKVQPGTTWKYNEESNSYKLIKV